MTISDLFINRNLKKVRAWAPATAANLAVGFDSLGMALPQPGDEVTLALREDDRLVIQAITPEGEWPLDSDKNTATIAIAALLKEHNLIAGFDVTVVKGTPLASGMGGSAASAVAGVVALNGYLATPLAPKQQLPYALTAEASVSGGIHPDNVAPALFGGMTLSISDTEVISLPCPDVTAILLHPDIAVSTRDARKLLPQEVPLLDHVRQSRCLAAFIASLYQKSWSLTCEQMRDYLIEPARAPLWPYYAAVKQAGYRAGADVVVISGSGPSVLALCRVVQQAQTIAAAMQQACRDSGYYAQYWIGAVPAPAAHIIEVDE
ncbi:MAG: homoserine kinase [Gammaproteobacteria bacterium]|nr:homoserine kinase [Gammaproteobacteria bacterium]